MSPTTRIWLRRIGAAAGLLLLAAAIAVVIGRRDALEAALAALADTRPEYVVVLLAAVVGNVVLTGLLFSSLMSRYGRVGLAEMQALIAAATLVNFLPLRPGMFGRVAYHRAVNGIPAADTARTIIQALVLSSALAGFLAMAVLACRGLALPLWPAVLLPAVVGGGLALHPVTRRWSLPMVLRWADLLVWAVRYYAAFAMIGSPVTAETAVALACVSVIAMLVPFVSNGLGLREWAVGLLAPFLAGYTVEQGLAAELVNRAAEIVVILPLGLAGTGCITWSWRRAPGPRP